MARLEYSGYRLLVTQSRASGMTDQHIIPPLAEPDLPLKEARELADMYRRGGMGVTGVTIFPSTVTETVNTTQTSTFA